MIPLEEATARVTAALPPPRVASCEVREALGLVTAQSLVAREAIPPFDNTAVDGFALRAADTATAPSRLRIVGEVRAGAVSEVSLGPGEAIRIMTGAPIPRGADAVVMVEDTETVGDEVTVSVVVPPGDAIRPAGDDVHIGDEVIAAGTELRAAHLGLIAELGLSEVSVFRRLRVGVIATGDELVGDGSPLQPGQIRESNIELLLALVEQAGCIPVDLGIVRDDPDAIAVALEDGVARCDALLTSGGVSMGEYDLIKVVLDKLGSMDWMQVAIRPAKPFAFGLLAGSDKPTPVFGLPGNPVSSFVSFELLARPALRRMMGHPAPARPVVRSIADQALVHRPSDERVHFVRVLASFGDDGRVHVTTTGAQGSHQLAGSAAANGLARVDGSGVVVGGEVPVTLLG